jgi:TolB-like protein/DNA-binding winged helix-turn-helix (wHTH) protein/Flp pilus assembly protein TadD
MTDTPFQVGDWFVDPANNRIQKGEFISKLEPRAMEVLVCLAQTPGRVISREELEETVWAGRIVTQDSLSTAINKLRKALDDDSRNPLYIETVSKRGYRLIALVSTGLQPDELIENPFDHKTSLIKTIFSSPQLLVSIVILVALLYALSMLNNGKQDTAVNEQPLVVVLPLESLGTDQEQNYFSDGITSDLITDLSKASNLRVMAPQTSSYFRQRKEEVTLREIGDELGVKFVIQGSIQKQANRIRINLQVSDVTKNESIWAERFDTDTKNLFAIQDKITQRVIKAMSSEFAYSDPSQSLPRAANFEAYDLFLQGLRYTSQRSKEGYDQAMSAYQKVIQLDPDYARAYGAMAVTLTHGYRFNWTELPLVEARERTLELAKQAVSLDQTTPQIYWALGYVHVHRKEYEQAEQAVLKSIELSPSYADGLALLGYISNWRGKARQAEKHIKHAIELNPYHSFDYPWNLGLSYYQQGRYEEAIAELGKALERNENAMNPRLFLAASLVRLGRIDDASWEIENIRISRPDTTLSRLPTNLSFEHERDIEAVIQDLRKAGLPE